MRQEPAPGTARSAAHTEKLILLRDGNNPDGATLVFDEHEWSAFIAGVKDGQFDLQTTTLSPRPATPPSPGVLRLRSVPGSSDLPGRTMTDVPLHLGSVHRSLGTDHRGTATAAPQPGDRSDCRYAPRRPR